LNQNRRGALLRAEKDEAEIRPHGAASRAGRLESIQWLRAVAAIGVVFTHAITRISTTFPLGIQHSLFTDAHGQLTVGDAGVDLFFVISGFIMLYVHGDDFGCPGAVQNFVSRRLLRIVPLYWMLTTVAVIFLIFAPQLFTTHYGGIDLAWIAGSYLFLPVAPPGGAVSPVVGVGWTLSYEMFFYAVFAGALLLPRKPGLRLVCLGFVSLVAAGTLLKASGAWLDLLTSWLLLDFLMGVAIAWWVLTRGEISRTAGYVLLASGLCCLAVTVVWTPPEQGPLRFLLWGIPAAVIVFAMCSVRVADSRPGGFGRVMSVLVDASYSIYLFQFFALPAWARAMRTVRMEAIPFDANVLILTALVTASGVGCWLLLERPLGSLARRLLKPGVTRFHHPGPATGG
jgi:exopolysaccharide production protein ExoZ